MQSRGLSTWPNDAIGGNVAYLSHGVGFSAVGNGGWRRAVGGIGSHNLGGVGDIVPGIRASHEGSGSNNDG